MLFLFCSLIFACFWVCFFFIILWFSSLRPSVQQLNWGFSKWWFLNFSFDMNCICICLRYYWWDFLLTYSWQSVYGSFIIATSLIKCNVTDATDFPFRITRRCLHFLLEFIWNASALNVYVMSVYTFMTCSCILIYLICPIIDFGIFFADIFPENKSVFWSKSYIHLPLISTKSRTVTLVIHQYPNQVMFLLYQKGSTRVPT